MINPASIAAEGVKVATGKKSASSAALYVFLLFTVEAFLKKEVFTMDALIYIPEGYNIPVFAMVIAFAIITPLLAAFFFKNESKNKDKPWTKMYIVTTLIDMFIAPSLGLITISVLVQEFMPNIDPVTYMVFLPIVMIIVAYLALKVMNEGIKAVYEQIKGVAKDVKEVADDANVELKKL